MRCAAEGASPNLSRIEQAPRAFARGQGAAKEVAIVINTKNVYAVIGTDHAAASARLLSRRPSWLCGGRVCLQPDERFTGLPGTPPAAASLRRRAGDPSVMKINKFELPSVAGSTVLRPPV